MTISEIQNIEQRREETAPELQKTVPARTTKADQLLKLLKSKRGAIIEQLQKASGWQAHSIRGFLSGTVKKKLGLNLVVETSENGARRYRTTG